LTTSSGSDLLATEVRRVAEVTNSACRRLLDTGKSNEAAKWQREPNRLHSSVGRKVGIQESTLLWDARLLLWVLADISKNRLLPKLAPARWFTRRYTEFQGWS
jgi:hypothetical protein